MVILFKSIRETGLARECNCRIRLTQRSSKKLLEPKHDPGENTMNRISSGGDKMQSAMNEFGKRTRTPKGMSIKENS